MNREVHVRFFEGLRVQLPWATHLCKNPRHLCKLIETSQKSQAWFKSRGFRSLNFAELIYSEVGFCFYTASARSRHWSPRTGYQLAAIRNCLQWMDGPHWHTAVAGIRTAAAGRLPEAVHTLPSSRSSRAPSADGLSHPQIPYGTSSASAIPLRSVT